MNEQPFNPRQPFLYNVIDQTFQREWLDKYVGFSKQQDMLSGREEPSFTLEMYTKARRAIDNRVRKHLNLTSKYDGNGNLRVAS